MESDDLTNSDDIEGDDEIQLRRQPLVETGRLLPIVFTRTDVHRPASQVQPVNIDKQVQVDFSFVCL